MTQPKSKFYSDRQVPPMSSGLSRLDRFAVALFEIEATIDENSGQGPTDGELLDRVWSMLQDVMAESHDQINESEMAQTYLGLRGQS